MTPILHVPATWLMMWLGGHNVRLTCPGCGGFSMDLVRSDDGSELKSLSCSACDLNGVAAVQRKLNAHAATPKTRNLEPKAIAQ